MSLLSSLNATQREAVTYLDGPLSVFAGPGTGKTRVTTYKVAYLIEQGYRPEEILALTFTQKAAQEMEDRVRELVPDARGIRISTFHSFCNEIVNDNALELGVNTGRTVLTEPYQQAFIYRHIRSLGLEYPEIPGDPRDLAKIFQSAISRFKQENIGLERLREYIERKEGELGEDPDEEDVAALMKLVRLYHVYEAYERFKEEKGLIDFEDMQLLALKVLEMPHIRKKYSERIRYIIVDEFQDTDYIQLQVLFRLAEDGNITIVGDDDQSIYRFRGAYLTNVQEFRQFYTDKGMPPKEIVLDMNYRSTEEILNAALELIYHNEERVEKSIRTHKGKGEDVLLWHYVTEQDQAYGIVRTIHELREKEGRDWKDFAILVRRRAEARAITEALRKAGMPYEILGARDYFEKPVIRSLYLYLKYINDPSIEAPLAHLLLRPAYGLTPLDVRLIEDLAKERKESAWEVMQKISSGEVDFEGYTEGVRMFVENMQNLFDKLGDEGLYELVRSILFSRDFFKIEVARENKENIRLLNRFLKMTEEYLDIYPDATLGEFVEQLDTMKRLGVSDEENEGSDEDRIHISTVHGAKGMEYPVVFVPALNESKFPTKYREDHIPVPDELSDGIRSGFSDEQLHYFEERRLLYVAMTRAKERLFLSYADFYPGRKGKYEKSRYRDDIKKVKGVDEPSIEPLEATSGDVHDALLDHLIKMVQRKEWQSALDAVLALGMSHGESISSFRIHSSLKVEDVLSEIESIRMEPVKAHAERNSYSPTQLSTYDKCPRQYYYSYILGIPGAPKTYFFLGSVVHKVVEIITKKMKGGENVDESDALKLLDTLWNPSVYRSEPEEKKDRELAEEMIRMFLRAQASMPGEILGIEEWVEMEIGGKRIHGRVDRMDLVDDNIVVIDYKTSKTPTSGPKLKKDFQMGLYWMGTEEAKGIPVRSVGHWYLRHDKRKMVEITPDELEEIKRRALEIIQNIEAGNFEATPNYQTCKYCDFRELCEEK